MLCVLEKNLARCVILMKTGLVLMLCLPLPHLGL